MVSLALQIKGVSSWLSTSKAKFLMNNLVVDKIKLLAAELALNNHIDIF